jgi:hypothetical protein
VRRQPCNVIGDCTFDTLGIGWQLSEFSAGKLRALPDNRGKIARRLKQLLYNRLAPRIDQLPAAFIIISRREFSAVCRALR